MKKTLFLITIFFIAQIIFFNYFSYASDPQPDLTIEAPLSVNAVVGQPVALTITVKNIGTAQATGRIEDKNLILINFKANEDDVVSNTNVGGGLNISPLAAGASDTASLDSVKRTGESSIRAISFKAPGVYTIKFTVDEPWIMYPFGTILESNENNNETVVKVNVVEDINLHEDDSNTNTEDNSNTAPEQISYNNNEKKVYLALKNLTATAIETVKWPNGDENSSLVLLATIKNTGNGNFDPHEKDPLNPDEDKVLYPWGGTISCGTVINPVAQEFFGSVFPGSLSSGQEDIFEAYLLNKDELTKTLKQGNILPCDISPLVGYYNVQNTKEGFSQYYEFDLFFNGKTDKIEVDNFRQRNTKRHTDFHSIDVGKKGESDKKIVPPAGYEDDVITNFSSYENPFPDTDSSSLIGKSAAELYRRAVIGGFPDGEFKGERNVNRAEAAKFLLLAKLGTVPNLLNTGKFSDVLEGQWYVKFIVQAANLGIINGYADGTFGPGKTVNTAEFLKMLTLTFGLPENLNYSYSDVSENDWFAKYAGIAEKYNLFPGRIIHLNPDQNLTRKDVAIAIYEYLLTR